MALTLTAMLTEVYARGFSYLNDSGAATARVTRWLNDAMHEIDDYADWPYLTATTTGAAPLTVSDLGVIECVTDVAHLTTLLPRERRDLRDAFADLTPTGTPTTYYVTGGTTINVYPANTSTTLTVDYWKVAPDMSAGSDTPLMPDRFRMAIVEYACAKAHLDALNEASAQSCRQAGDQVVARMMQRLLIPSHQGPSVVVGPVGDDN